MRLKKKHIFFDTLLLFLLVLSGGSLFFKAARNELSIALFFLSLFVLFFMGKKLIKSIFNSSLFVFLIFSFIVILNYVFSQFVSGEQQFIKYAFHIMNILSCLLILTHFKNNRNQEYFLNRVRYILNIVLYYSIINFFAYFFVKSNLTDFIGGYNDDLIAHTYKYLFFFDLERNVFDFFGLEIIRNQGWFWEPGINQIYLNLLLYLEGFVFKRGKWTVPLIVFAIITTYSTTGIFIMIFLLSVIFINSIKRNPFLYIGLALLISYPLYYLGKSNFDNKAGQNVSSMNKRLFDLVQPLSIALNNPMTGVGLDAEHFQKYRSVYYLDNETQSFLTLETTEKGSSNSITFLLAATGFPMGLFLLYCFFKQDLFTHRKKIFMLVITISVLSEPLLLRPFFLLFIISGMFHIVSRFTNHKPSLA